MNEAEAIHRAQSRRTTVKTARAAYVARAVRLYPDDILSITLYGSQARGDAKTESDIDVLVVVRRDSSALREALTDVAWQVQFEYGVVISDIVRSIEQFNRMRANRFPFYENIEREGVLLWRARPSLCPFTPRG